MSSSDSSYAVTHALSLDGVADYIQLNSPSTRSSARIGTLDFWFKRNNDGGSQVLFAQDSPDTGYGMYLWLDSSKRLQFSTENADGSVMLNRISSGTFLDTISWYHVNIQWDTGQTDNTCCTIRVNGVAIAMGTITNPGSARDNPIFKAGNHIRIGRWQNNDATRFMNVSFAHVCYHDGVQCINAETSNGIWVPTDPTDNAFGDGGFFLKFSGANLGTDSSGNSHTFVGTSVTPNNIIIDNPMNSDEEEITLYPTWEEDSIYTTPTLSNHNLTAAVDRTDGAFVKATIGIKGGIYYWEVKVTSLSGSGQISLVREGHTSNVLEGAITSYANWQNSGVFAHNGNPVVTTAAGWSVNDVIGVLLDSTNGRLYFSVNDDWEDGSGGSASSATVLSEITGGTGTTYAMPTFVGSIISDSRWYPAFQNPHSGTDTVTINFGHISDFEETKPSNASKLTATITGAGNYPTINPHLTSVGTLSNGNLTGGTTGSSVVSFVATHAISSGKFYWEVTLTSGSSVSSRIGIATTDSVSATAPNGASSIYIGQETTDDKTWAFNAWADGANDSKIEFGNGSAQRVSYGEGATSGFVKGDVVGVALDMDNGALWFSKNGTWLGGNLGAGNPATISEIAAGTVTNAAVGPNANCADNINLSSLTVIPVFTVDAVTATTTFNFGATPFAYAVPSGFKSLTTSNMATLSVSSPATGSFTGNSSTDGPFIYLGYAPDTSGTSTITEAGGSASTITWGTHARAYSNGFKIIASADDYNKAAVNAYSIAIDTDAQFANNNRGVVT